MTGGNGFLLDRGSRPRRQKPIRRNSSTEDEDQNQVALLVFPERTVSHRSRLGRCAPRRITNATIRAQEAAPLDNAGTRMVGARDRVDHAIRPGLHTPTAFIRRKKDSNGPFDPLHELRMRAASSDGVRRPTSSKALRAAADDKPTSEGRISPEPRMSPLASRALWTRAAFSLRVRDRDPKDGSRGLRCLDAPEGQGHS